MIQIVGTALSLAPEVFINLTVVTLPVFVVALLIGWFLRGIAAIWVCALLATLASALLYLVPVLADAGASHQLGPIFMPVFIAIPYGMGYGIAELIKRDPLYG